MTENELMLTSVLDCRRVDLVADPRKLTPVQESRYRQMQKRRAQGEPLQYITGQCEFMGILLAVDARVLIPRPETEILVELAVEKTRSLSATGTVNILDIGTGSGNISIALSKNIKNAIVTTVDISNDALVLAEQNADTNDVRQRIKFVCDDMDVFLRKAAGRGETYDMIISNPPYIPTAQWTQLPDDVRQEPRAALDGGRDGLHFCRMIIQNAYRALRPGGFLIMEIGDGQREYIETIFRDNPYYSRINFHKDYVGTDRIVIAWKN